MPAATIIATTRKPENLAHLASLGISVRAADFENHASLAAAFAGAARCRRGGRRAGQIVTGDVGNAAFARRTVQPARVLAVSACSVPRWSGAISSGESSGWGMEV